MIIKDKKKKKIEQTYHEQFQDAILPFHSKEFGQLKRTNEQQSSDLQVEAMPMLLPLHFVDQNQPNRKNQIKSN